VFQSLAISSINLIIFGAISTSAVLIVLFSILLKSMFCAIYFPTCFVYPKISVQNFSFKNCLAKLPAKTLEVVSLALLLQPHL